MEGKFKNVLAWFKLPLQIAIGVTLAMFIDHFATKPAIGHLESLMGKK